MAILDIQRRLAQTGRIRIGEQVTGERRDGTTYKRPKKSETFRLTSSSKAAIEACSKRYGGVPHPWTDAPTEGQWELFTTSSTLDILIPPESVSFSQYYELWSGGGCKRRCNGAFQVPSEDDCVCDPDNRECKPHTRLSVMLSDMPGAGLWRLDTQGWNAANEMNGAFELAQLIAQARGFGILPGVLRLDQRESKRPDPKDPTKTITRKFAVPVIDFDLDLAVLARGTQAAISSPITPVHIDDEVTVSVAEQLERINTPPEKPKRANAAEPVRPTGIAPRARGALRTEGDDAFGTDDDPGATAGADLHEKFAAAFGMLEAADTVVATKRFDFLGYSRRRDSWTAEQIDNALSIVDEILKSKAQVEVEGLSSTNVLVTPDAVIPARANKNKVTQLSMRFEECGFGDRDIILEYCSKVAKRPITTRNDLTTAEANLVLAQLSSDAEQ